MPPSGDVPHAPDGVEATILSLDDETALLQGYVCDLQQRRPEAEQFYRRVLGLREEGAEPLYALNPLVLHSAENRLSIPFQKGDVDATTVSFSFQSGWE